MGTNCRSKSSSDRENWNNIFKGLVDMLQNQQTQLESLAKERKLLEDRIKLQHERWLSDISLFEHQISKCKGDLVVQEMASSLEAAKSELNVGLRRREVYFSKLRLEYAESELEDFKALFKLVSKKSVDQKGEGKESEKKSSKSFKNVEQRSENLESELRRLKHEYDKVVMEKNSEVSSLLAEKNFVWNQYKVLENECESKLKSKNLKVEQAEEKVQSLIASMEHLQSSNDRKDQKIMKLSSLLTKMKEESDKLKEESFRLSKELELLRKPRSDNATPVLTRCTSETTRSSKPRVKQSDRNDGSVLSRKASDSKEDSGKGSRRLKRPFESVPSTSDSPRLFTSSFKVPKLKNSASVVRA